MTSVTDIVIRNSASASAALQLADAMRKLQAAITESPLMQASVIEALQHAKDADPMRDTDELIVFADGRQADAAGFRNGRHPTAPGIKAWWPSLGLMSLKSRPLRRIMIMWGVSLDTEALQILRNRQASFRNPIWIEL